MEQVQMKQKLIYVCSPYRGDVKNNKEKAKEFAKKVLKEGHLPICVHVFLNEVSGMSERNGQRIDLLILGRQYVEVCDEVWVFGNKATEGMKGEIKIANKRGIKVRWFKNYKVKKEANKTFI